jgi:hypothetical protein
VLWRLSLSTLFTAIDRVIIGLMLASGEINGCDGRCVQGPGTYSPRHADPRLLVAPETYFYEVLWAARLTYHNTLHSPLLYSRVRDSFSWAPDLPVPRLGAVSVVHPVIYFILD